MSAKEVVELGKSIFDLLKSLMIAFLIISFFALPKVINTVLSEIGITEFDLWGLRGKTSLVELADDLVEQQAATRNLTERLKTSDDLLQTVAGERDTLRRQLEDANREIERLASLANEQPKLLEPSIALSDTQMRELKAALNANAATIGAAQTTQAQTSQSLAANQEAISIAQATVAPTRSSWGVVFGADTTPADARPEVERARKAGFDTAKLYRRYNWYRSVIEFPTREAASGALDGIRKLSSTAKDAYVVNLASWCPGGAEPVDDTIVECRT